jgi:hypothetical protein
MMKAAFASIPQAHPTAIQKLQSILVLDTGTSERRNLTAKIMNATAPITRMIGVE